MLLQSDPGSLSVGFLLAIGLLCSFCRCHTTQQGNGIGTWRDKPCTNLGKDMHGESSSSAL